VNITVTECADLPVNNAEYIISNWHCWIFCYSQFNSISKSLVKSKNTRRWRAALTGGGLAWWLRTFVSLNKVNLRRAGLVLEWVTVSRFNFRCRIFVSVCTQPPRSTQPGHPFVGRCSVYQKIYQSKGGDLRLGSKSRYGSCVGGR